MIDALATRVGEEFNAIRAEMAGISAGSISDTGWVPFTMGAGPDSPWGTSSVQQYAEYRIVGGLVVTVRVGKTASSTTYTGSATGNFTNMQINNNTTGLLPAPARPSQNTPMYGQWNDLVANATVTATGAIVILGGVPNGTYGSGNTFHGLSTYMLG